MKNAIDGSFYKTAPFLDDKQGGHRQEVKDEIIWF